MRLSDVFLPGNREKSCGASRNGSYVGRDACGSDVQNAVASSVVIDPPEKQMGHPSVESVVAPSRIVLAEDGEDDRALAFRALRKCNSSLVVQVAPDGQRALELLLSDDVKPPELVLLDIKMPLVSGIDVLERLRKDSRYDSIPIVMLTSSDEPTDIGHSKRLGASSFVRKPVDYGEYLRVLSDVANHWLAPNPLGGPPHCLLVTKR